MMMMIMIKTMGVPKLEYDNSTTIIVYINTYIHSGSGRGNGCGRGTGRGSGSGQW